MVSNCQIDRGLIILTNGRIMIQINNSDKCSLQGVTESTCVTGMGYGVEASSIWGA